MEPKRQGSRLAVRTTFHIHIGVHKTGTKSIQQTLSENRETLLKNGINSFPGDPNHGPALISLFSGNPHQDPRNIRRHVDTPEKATAYNAVIQHRILNALKRNRSPKFVISGEGLSTLPLESIEQLKQMLAPYAAAYRIIVYVRDPYEYANSASLQRLKTGGILELPSRLFPLPNYQRRLRRWIQAFGRENVDIRLFEPKRFIGGDLVSDFLSAIGESAELAKSLEIVRANQSMSHEAALILSETNKVIPAYVDGRAHRRRAFDFHLRVANIEGEKFTINPDDYLKHEAEALADIEWLSATIGEPAFARPRPRPASSPRWSEATVLSIKKEVKRMVRALRSREKHFFLPAVVWPAIPPELEWLRGDYNPKPHANDTQSPVIVPEFNEATIIALGRFFHEISLTIQHRKAEQFAFKRSFLIWISRRRAENFFRKVVRLHPACARGQYRLSQAYLLRGHFIEARRAAEAAAKLAPNRLLFRGWLKLVNAAGRWFFKPKTESENSLPSRPRVGISEEDRIKRQKARAARGAPGLKAGRAALRRPPP